MGVFEQAVQTAIKKEAGKLQIKQTIVGTATNIRETLCNIERENAPTLFDVRLNAIDDDLQSFVTVYPKEGSKVIAGIIENLKTEAVVLRCSEVEKIKLKIGNQTAYIDKNGFVFNDGTLGGLVKVGDLTQRLNNLENDINGLKNAFNTWIVFPGDGGAALKAITAAWTSQRISVTQQANIENKNIKQ